MTKREDPLQYYAAFLASRLCSYPSSGLYRGYYFLAYQLVGIDSLCLVIQHSLTALIAGSHREPIYYLGIYLLFRKAYLLFWMECLFVKNKKKVFTSFY